MSRTTEVGLYHYANLYRRAADALGTIKSDSTHPDAPRDFRLISLQSNSTSKPFFVFMALASKNSA